MAKKAKTKSKPKKKKAPPTRRGTATVEILSPQAGRAPSSPLAIVVARYAGAACPSGFVRVNGVVHVVELAGVEGKLVENVTLLEGENAIEVEVDGTVARLTVNLPRSERVTLGPDSKDVPAIATRAVEVTGRFENVSCPAGVIAVNGFMQQFAIQGVTGGFAEKIVLRPGDNHVAVQIGEVYATRLYKGTFAPSKVLVTLVWNTNSTDVDLHTHEPDGKHVYYASKLGNGNLDVDRTQGYGPENYSLGRAGEKVSPAGNYRVRVHYFADRGVGRTEWTTRVLTDEGRPEQRRYDFYGIINRTGDWNDVCRVVVAKDGTVKVE